MSDFKTFYLKVKDSNEAATILKQCRQSFGGRGETWDFAWLNKHTTIQFTLLPESKANTILRLKYGDKLTTGLEMFGAGYQNTAFGCSTLPSNTSGSHNVAIGCSSIPTKI